MKRSFIILWSLIVFSQTNAQTPELKKTYPFFATLGINQLVTTKYSVLEVPTLCGLNGAVGVGPIWRMTLEGQFSAHRMLGAGDALKNGFLIGYSWRAGIIPHKPFPLHFYFGGGYHVYRQTFDAVEISGYQFLPAIRSRRVTDYLTFGVSYPIYKCLEFDLSYRRESFIRSEFDINSHYLALGINAWLYKYDRFLKPKVHAAKAE
jgi:hypothetical protein